MRKYTTSVVLLIAICALSGCENNPSSQKKADSKKTVLTNPFVKKKKPAAIDSTQKGWPESKDRKDTISQPTQTDTTAINRIDERESDLMDNDDSQIEQDTTHLYVASDSAQVDSLDPSEDFPDEADHDAYFEQGSYSDSGLRLEKERLVKTEIVNVGRPGFKSQRDSALAAVEKRISLKPEEVSKTVVVELWISPVNYRGYKFNRKKLMLYGVDTEAPLRIYYYLNDYFLSLGNHVYYLDEAVENTAFIAVQDSILANYLLKYDPQL